MQAEHSGILWGLSRMQLSAVHALLIGHEKTSTPQKRDKTRWGGGVGVQPIIYKIQVKEFCNIQQLIQGLCSQAIKQFVLSGYGYKTSHTNTHTTAMGCSCSETHFRRRRTMNTEYRDGEAVETLPTVCPIPDGGRQTHGLLDLFTPKWKSFNFLLRLSLTSLFSRHRERREECPRSQP